MPASHHGDGLPSSPSSFADESACGAPVDVLSDDALRAIAAWLPRCALPMMHGVCRRWRALVIDTFGRPPSGDGASS